MWNNHKRGSENRQRPLAFNGWPSARLRQHFRRDHIPTSAFFALVQNGGTRTVGRRVEHYDLDIIISVGYRVKSRQGV
ncbi:MULTISPECIES: RhuM family protein [Collinsella]|uniref:RhuM family protein n=1 Tax=Collinsella TaxID=102106 RepID=UPI0009E94CF4|nr:hypothetical protein DXD42_00580 [Collinsella sp. TM04-9]RGJ95517.1 hypothetical protein DXD39_05020 [Collinsella sp. TM04-29]